MSLQLTENGRTGEAGLVAQKRVVVELRKGADLAFPQKTEASMYAILENRRKMNCVIKIIVQVTEYIFNKMKHRFPLRLGVDNQS